MGEIHVSGHSQYSPPSSYDDASSRQSYHRTRQSSSVSGGMWPTGAVGPSHGVPTFPAGTQPVNPASSSTSTSMPMGSTGGSQFVYPEYGNPSMAQNSPMMSSAGYQQTRPQSSMAGHASQAFSSSGRSAPAYRAPRGVDDEFHQLRIKIRELELINEEARLRIRALEAEVANPAQGHLN